MEAQTKTKSNSNPCDKNVKDAFMQVVDSIPPYDKNGQGGAYLEVYLIDPKKPRHFTTWLTLEQFRASSEAVGFETTVVTAEQFTMPPDMRPTYTVKPEEVKEIGYNWERYPVSQKTV